MQQSTGTRIFVVLACTLTTIIGAVGITPASAATPSTTATYVDCRAARNGDGSAAAPLNTLAAASAATASMAPGGRMYFAAGTTCRGVLDVRASGTASAPLVFATDPAGRAAGGQRAVLDGAVPGSGDLVDTMKIVNQSFVTVTDLTLTNSTPRPTNGQEPELHALRVVARDPGDGGTTPITVQGITLSGVTVQDVGCSSADASTCFRTTRSDVRGRSIAAVDFGAWKSSARATALRDISVRGSTFRNIAGTAIRTMNEWSEDGGTGTRTTGYSLLDNTFDFTTGAAWTIGATDRAVVRGNTMNRFSMGPWLTSAGGSLHYTSRTLIERNTASNGASYPYTKCLDLTSGTGGCNVDGQAFDLGEGVQNTIVQDNVSTDNGRGFLMFCTASGANGPTKKTAHTLIRGNISRNDHLYGIRQVCGEGQADTVITQNTFSTDFTRTDPKLDRRFAVFANVDIEAPDNAAPGGPTWTTASAWNAQSRLTQDQIMTNNLVVNASPTKADVMTLLRYTGKQICTTGCFTQRGYQAAGNVFQNVRDRTFAGSLNASAVKLVKQTITNTAFVSPTSSLRATTVSGFALRKGSGAIGRSTTTTTGLRPAQGGVATPALWPAIATPTGTDLFGTKRNGWSSFAAGAYNAPGR